MVNSTSVMINFRCLLDWVMGCSDIWLNIILGMSARVLPDKSSI